MRIETISFTDMNGRSYPIKDIRPIPEYITRTTINVKEKDRIDEIASRVDIYGPEGYTKSYKIFDHNRVVLMDHNLNLTRIKELRIPD